MKREINMCLNPVSIRTNSKYVSLGYKKYYLQVPCGECAECQMMKKNEWYLRNYYEFELTKSSNGYVMFDTLTYSDDYLPSVYKRIVGINGDEDINSLLGAVCKFDFDELKYLSSNNHSCFNYSHVQNFLKLLRIRLERSGYDVKSCLRYFICSEYGHDNIYLDSHGHSRKGTNRPHYHVLFYINNPKLPPLVLASFIKDCWKYGRTDNDLTRPDRNVQYILNNVFGERYISDPNRLSGVFYYVSKYVCKDYEFSDAIDTRVKRLLLNFYKLDYNSEAYKEKRRSLRCFMNQFHRQSLGFGLSAIFDKKNIDTIWSHGVIIIPDKDKVMKSIPIPMYYIRHLFQRCVKDVEGKLHWIWTDIGKKWKAERLKFCITQLSTKMSDWYNNLSTYFSGSPYFDVNSYRSKIDKIMNGRSWTDYATYILFYKGRLCLDPLNPITDVDSIISQSLSDPNFSIPITIDLDKYTMDDTCLDKFNGFDMISDMYRVSMIQYNMFKQDEYEKTQTLKRTAQELGLKSRKRI